MSQELKKYLPTVEDKISWERTAQKFATPDIHKAEMLKFLAAIEIRGRDLINTYGSDFFTGDRFYKDAMDWRSATGLDMLVVDQQFPA